MNNKLHHLKDKLKSLIKLKDTPYSIAMGAAIGVFWNFIPSLGVGPFLSIGLAKIMKASGVAALTINLGTGFFIPLFYSLNLLMGRAITRHDLTSEELSDTIQKSFKDSLETVEEVAQEPTKYFLLDHLQTFSVDFFLGGFINAILAGGLLYLILWSLLSYRQHWKRTHGKHKDDGDNCHDQGNITSLQELNIQANSIQSQDNDTMDQKTTNAANQESAATKTDR